MQGVAERKTVSLLDELPEGKNTFAPRRVLSSKPDYKEECLTKTNSAKRFMHREKVWTTFKHPHPRRQRHLSMSWWLLVLS